MNDPQPLAGRRIVVTRQEAQAEALCRRLAERGADPIRFPTIDFRPLPAAEMDHALKRLDDYAWIVFSSPNAVRFFLRRLKVSEQELVFPRIAAIGPSTAAELIEAGIEVDFVPAEHSGEALAATLPSVAERSILVPRTRQGRPEVVDGLRKRGAHVDDVAIYETVPAEPTASSPPMPRSSRKSQIRNLPATSHAWPWDTR